MILASISEEGLQPLESLEPKSSQEPEPDADENRLESMFADGQHENSGDTSASTFQDASMSDGEVSSKLKSIKKRFMEWTKDYGVPQLERLYTRLMKGVLETKNAVNGGKDLKPAILSFLLKFADKKSNFFM